MQIRSKVWLDIDGELVFGTGKAGILKAVERSGSLNQAAKELNMSYRRAWSYIQTAEKRLGRPLLIKVKGGSNGGGASLTDFAQGLLKNFEALEKDVKTFTDKRFKEVFEKGLKDETQTV